MPRRRLRPLASRIAPPSGPLVLVGLLITQMIPGIVITNGLFPIYNSVGLVHTYAGLILADASLGVPFCMLLMRSFVVNIPSSLLEVARIDGASEFRLLVSIVVPLSRNVIVTAGVFAFLFAWSDFLFALTLTTGDTVMPITLSMNQFVGAHTQSWGAMMTTATLAGVPAAVLLVLAQRYIAAGVTGGAVKRLRSTAVALCQAIEASSCRCTRWTASRALRA